uniref:Uncharacterized protein n=1 Tax=Arundo donax TaxID=35708 RepID=A0A0A9BU30_ARUDO
MCSMHPNTYPMGSMWGACAARGACAFLKQGELLSNETTGYLSACC